nr:immunoglobulin light chain junction region [Macaca mulatta]MOY04937.1 immunoglobulin light chain junction region [Macaca mulatta]MOY04953.1 immunoglobulin light chain junction region [Macaca mulatta]MOY05108.1 immunoglobulin light chain junction region [Macaca mulatta]MOY05110.1 immunoglobulin light chain junction region [Macaca mulatta]
DYYCCSYTTRSTFLF